ncbi:hypothetical protein [Streptomyces sp. bgisy154]|uniref:hypothetical protein n=1 Tax=Streptomyces sp. bgisy154 TaxID=3413794 RepID=UPI003D74A744
MRLGDLVVVSDATPERRSQQLKGDVITFPGADTAGNEVPGAVLGAAGGDT